MSDIDTECTNETAWLEPLRAGVCRALRNRTAVTAALLAATLCEAPAIAGTFPAELELSSLLIANGGDGSIGLVLNGTDESGAAGHAVAAGDLNGDDIDDLIIAAPYVSPGGRFIAGVAYVIFGDNQGFAPEIPLSGLLPMNGGDGSAGFVLNGIYESQSIPASVDDAGDVNGDGVGDLILGSNQVNPNGQFGAGQSYVVFGTDQGFPAEIELSSLLTANGGDGGAGFVLNGTNEFDGSGRSVSAAGDMNGDGIADVLVGAFGVDSSAGSSAGAGYVLFGTDQGFPAEIELSSLLAANGGDGSVGTVLNGANAGDRAGIWVSAAGDVNGDNLDDVIVGARAADPGGRDGAGASYVIFGNDQGFPAEFELSSLHAANGGDGSAGFVLNGANAGDNTGVSVSAAGDVNGDGIGDVIVGADYASPGGRAGAGASYIVFGSDQGFPAEIELSNLLAANGGDGSIGFVLNGIDAGDQAGTKVNTAGDVNGDGTTDVIVGVRHSSPGGRDDAGASYLVFGSNQGFSAEIELSSLLSTNGGDGSIGFVLNGIDAGDRAGNIASAAGDINGDGISDVVVGARNADPAGESNAGETYVVFGRADTDGDGVADAMDNCTLAANADQRDSNEDGIGNACDPDLNNDCAVNFEDLGLLKSVFFGSDPDADFNGDGSVNFVDLGIAKELFFLAPGPSEVPNICDGT